MYGVLVQLSTSMFVLKGLTKLRMLELSDNNVTDAGLEHLKGLTNPDLLHSQCDNNYADAYKKPGKSSPNTTTLS